MQVPVPTTASDEEPSPQLIEHEWRPGVGPSSNDAATSTVCPSRNTAPGTGDVMTTDGWPFTISRVAVCEVNCCGPCVATTNIGNTPSCVQVTVVFNANGSANVHGAGACRVPANH